MFMHLPLQGGRLVILEVRSAGAAWSGNGKEFMMKLDTSFIA